MKSVEQITTLAELPPFVERDEHCRLDVNLDNCDLMQLELQTSDGTGRYVVIPRNTTGERRVRPAQPGQRFTELRPGDEVLDGGQVETIKRVIVYR